MAENATTGEDLYSYDEAFRDTIGTVDEKGNRIWVYPKKPFGRFHNYRAIVAVVLLILLFAGPFIKVNGHPFLLFNVFERKFILFGTAFWPQDFHILALIMISFVVFIVLFTVVYGRVWCGWACPQTIFMEMVFRKIEYWIDGDAIKQKKLKAAPWNATKIWKRSLKFVLFLAISLLISHTVMAYLVGLDQVVEIVSQPPTERLAGFIGLMAFTGIFFFVFWWFREQACVAVCPYGRLQGVFLGNHSISVIYDWIRGEPRGKLKKNEPQADNGDCIDCKMCVHVCPTGIDIRNGTQLECVNCTACIDACDDIMDKVGKPRGLIRYGSIDGVKEGRDKIFTTRVAGYSVVLALLLSVIAFMLTTRSDIEATVLRVPGQLYQKQENNRISNLYDIKFVNKTFEDVEITLNVEDYKDVTIKQVSKQDDIIEIPANSVLEGVFFIEMSRDDIQSMNNKITLQLIKEGEVMDEVRTSFFGPAK
ncbi:MAG TPA: cytochrome c oxidase accessory protein CcoG [Cytophagales bacterium]|jgi:cytochrome c oxidase accessory protein FixG|nr:cytochrome c oxidase accessory protein CcoG [Cytophagales bacterium]